MGRPKGSINKASDTQGVETATKEPVNTGGEEVKSTTVVEVKVKKPEPLPLKKGGAFLDCEGDVCLSLRALPRAGVGACARPPRRWRAGSRGRCDA